MYTVTQNKTYSEQPPWLLSTTDFHTVVLTRPVVSIWGNPVLEDTVTVVRWQCGPLTGFYRNHSKKLTQDAVGVGGVFCSWLLPILIYETA